MEAREDWDGIGVGLSPEREELHDQLDQGQQEDLQTKYSGMTNLWINSSIVREQGMLKAGHHMGFGNELFSKTSSEIPD